ncbi:hypothetical protein [Nocardioides maradonensis]
MQDYNVGDVVEVLGWVGRVIKVEHFMSETGATFFEVSAEYLDKSGGLFRFRHDDPLITVRVMKTAPGLDPGAVLAYLLGEAG